MSIAEHVTVFISIIIGIAVGDLLMSFHRLLRARERVRWDWIPLGVALFALVLTVNYWWLAFGWHSNARELTVADFMPTLAQFVVLFLLVAASLPDDVRDEGLDLRTWYFSNARLYWSLAAISVVLDIVVDGMRQAPPGGGMADILRLKLNEVIALPFLLVMIFSRRRWYHAAFVALSLINMTWVTVSIALGS